MTTVLDPSRIRAVVFDVDGTLYPHRPVRRAMLLRLVLRALTSPRDGYVTARALQAYRRAQEHLRDAAIDEGGVADAQLRLAARHSGVSEAAVSAIVQAWMHEAPLPVLARLIDPELHVLLDALRARGVALGVLSDYPAHAKLEALGLAGRFDVVLSAQDPSVNRFKPHPGGLLEALRRLGVAPQEAVYVGDRHDVDAPTAAAAGVPCVIVRGKGARPGATWTTAADFHGLHTVLVAQSGAS